MAIAFVVLFLSFSTLGEARGFRQRSAADIRTDVRAVHQELQEALHGALGQGHGIDSKQIAAANATLVPMFQSLPKNSKDRVGATAMRYAVQRYFSKSHGWIIKGFEAHSVQQTDNSTSIMWSKVPGYVEAILEDRLQKEGYSLADIMTVVVVIERLIFDEVAGSVEQAYQLNHVATEQQVDKDSLMTILESHMIVELLERHEFDEEVHQEDRQEIHELYPTWDALHEFMEDVIAVETSSIFQSGARNPFLNLGTEVFTFDDAVRIAQQISNEYGRWGNQECMELRTFLSDMDKDANGRVPLSTFYKAPDDRWAFQETPEYLRELGALDESSKWIGPQVIISNYAYGMSNCLSSTPYYSVCCLNECEGLLQQIEVLVAKPSATPDEILIALARTKLNSGEVDVATLQSKSYNRLEEIASKGTGKVSLHGRLFAQWLHYAFPQECPYPHAAGSLRPRTQGERLAKDEDIFVDPERLAELASQDEVNSGEDIPEEEDLWSWDEELMHAPEPGTSSHNGRSTMSLWPVIIAAGILFAIKQLHTVVVQATQRRMLLPTTISKSHDL